MNWTKKLIKLFALRVNVHDGKLMNGNKQVGEYKNGVSTFYKAPGPNWLMRKLGIERKIIFTYYKSCL